MAGAADPADTTRAPGILTAILAPPTARPDDEGAPTSVWDSEGGHLAEARTPDLRVHCPLPVRAEEPFVMTFLQTAILAVAIAVGIAGLITVPRAEPVPAR
jgi:hypothetical protein